MHEWNSMVINMQVFLLRLYITTYNICVQVLSMNPLLFKYFSMNLINQPLDVSTKSKSFTLELNSDLKRDQGGTCRWRRAQGAEMAGRMRLKKEALFRKKMTILIMYVVRHEYCPVTNDTMNVVISISKFIDNRDFCSVRFDHFLFLSCSVMTKRQGNFGHFSTQSHGSRFRKVGIHTKTSNKC